MSALIVGAFLFTSGTVMGQNLLVNPGFETGDGTPWVSGVTDPITVETGTVHAGTYAAHGNVEQYIDLVKDSSYVLMCWAYNTTPTINTWVGVRDLGLTGPAGLVARSEPLDSAGYEFVKLEFTALTTGSHRFWCWGLAMSDYWSDSWVLLKKGTSLTSIDLPKSDKIEILNQPNQVMINIEEFRQEATINVYELTGKLIHTEMTTNARTILDSNTFGKSGSYFVQVKTAKGFYAKQVMIITE